MAQRVHPEHRGASTVTNYAYGRSVEGAVARAREPGGLYGDEGLVPGGGGGRGEPVQRAAAAGGCAPAVPDHDPGDGPDKRGESENPDADLLGLLDDFFTRAVFFPDPHTGRVCPQPHQATFGWTSEPGGWHKTDASIWNDLGAACIPHAAIWKPTGIQA